MRLLCLLFFRREHPHKSRRIMISASPGRWMFAMARKLCYFRALRSDFVSDHLAETLSLNLPLRVHTTVMVVSREKYQESLPQWFVVSWIQMIWFRSFIQRGQVKISASNHLAEQHTLKLLYELWWLDQFSMLHLCELTWLLPWAASVNMKAIKQFLHHQLCNEGLIERWNWKERDQKNH